MTVEEKKYSISRGDLEVLIDDGTTGKTRMVIAMDILSHPVTERHPGVIVLGALVDCVIYIVKALVWCVRILIKGAAALFTAAWEYEKKQKKT